MAAKKKKALKRAAVVAPAPAAPVAEKKAKKAKKHADGVSLGTLRAHANVSSVVWGDETLHVDLGERQSLRIKGFRRKEATALAFVALTAGHA